MLSVRSADLKKTKIDTLAVPVCEDKNIYLDTGLKAAIKKALSLTVCSGVENLSLGIGISQGCQNDYDDVIILRCLPYLSQQPLAVERCFLPIENHGIRSFIL